MIERVAFTGISNLTNSKYNSSMSFENDYGVPVNFLKVNSDKITLQLNNKGERDLDEMKPVLDKFRDSRNLNFLRVERLNSGAGDVYIVNGKIVDVNDENLGVFSKIQKLLKKIQKDVQSPDIKDCYKDGEDFVEDRALSNLSKESFDKIVKDSAENIIAKHSGEFSESTLKKMSEMKLEAKKRPVKDCLDLSITKQTAADLERYIQKTMERYFKVH